jgi:hypothetical protein
MTETIQQINLLLENVYDIQPKQHIPINFRADLLNGFYVFDIRVEQTRKIIDDIIVIVFDTDNYRIWTSNMSAVAAGANKNLLPQPVSLSYAKVTNSLTVFAPPREDDYHLVLDNTHSNVTPKKVAIKVYWIWTGSPLTNIVKSTLMQRNWNEIWGQIENAIKAISETRTADACNNLRMGLITLLIKTCEILEKRKIEIDPGKTPDIGQFIDILKRHAVSEDITGMITRVWSFVSERTHIEKREGQQPLLDEVSYGYYLIIATFGYLLNINSEL